MNYPGNNSNAGATIISIVVIVGLIVVSVVGRACMADPSNGARARKKLGRGRMTLG